MDQLNKLLTSAKIRITCNRQKKHTESQAVTFFLSAKNRTKRYF
jgi:hypothetical protein